MEVGWWGGHGHSCVDDRGDGGGGLVTHFHQHNNDKGGGVRWWAGGHGHVIDAGSGLVMVAIIVNEGGCGCVLCGHHHQWRWWWL